MIYNGKKVGYNIETFKKAGIGDTVQVVGVLGPYFNVKRAEIIVMEKWSYEFYAFKVSSCPGFSDFYLPQLLEI